jgi:chromosome segregation ATPase
MTFIGKILVIVVMAFSLIFLGISTVTLSTAKNWSPAIQKEQSTVTDLKKKLADATAQADATKKILEDAKGQLDQEKKTLESKITTLQDGIRRDVLEIASVRERLDAAHQKAQSTMQEVQAKRNQINALRAKITAVEKQTGEFQQHRGELTDLIRDLERTLGTVSQNSSDLHGR